MLPLKWRGPAMVHGRVGGRSALSFVSAQRHRLNMDAGRSCNGVAETLVHTTRDKWRRGKSYHDESGDVPAHASQPQEMCPAKKLQ